MGIAVRRGNHEDIQWILTELKKFSAFNNSKYPLYDDQDYCEQYIKLLLDFHLVLICVDANDNQIGLVAGFYSAHHFNPKIKVLSELFYWVKEEARNSKAALKLINEFKTIGEQTADWVFFSTLPHSPMRPQSLLKRGFKMQETQWLLEV